VTRWEPDAQGRLAQAALELYAERGFDRTTVAEIAERAGLTERTFFRHYADKREVHFAGSSDARAAVVRGVVEAPASAVPLDVAAAGIEAVAELLQGRRDFARRRRDVIAATPELQERELIKLASWASAIADALRERGVDEHTATLVGEVTVAAFRTASERWVAAQGDADLLELFRESVDELRLVTARRPAAA
jgi:AcrR family transcriptional regulator